jgi:hypothetical protein
MTRPVVATRRLILTALLLTTAACHRPAEPPLGAGVAERAPPHPASAAGPPAFVGRWAVARAACARQPWVLTSDQLRSPSVLSCSFDKVNPTDAGYTIYSVCTVGKAQAPGRLVFTLTGQGSTRSLTVNGGPFTEPMALARCPETAAAQSASSEIAQGG